MKYTREQVDFRILKEEEKDDAIQFCIKVFTETYTENTQEQNDQFAAALTRPGYKESMVMYGLFIDGQMVGVTGFRPLQRIKATKEQVLEEKVEPAPSAAPVAEKATKTIKHITSYHNEVLRTGQCLVQDHGDIILNAGINSGSEVIASGNIHIYGSVRGRVIAGAGGNIAARIFCHCLEAELVSIAGTYCVADDIPAHVTKKPVHIYLNDSQELVFEALEF